MFGNKNRHGIHIKKLKIMNKDRLLVLKRILQDKDEKKGNELKIGGR